MADDGRPATRAKTDGDDPAGAAAAADDAGAAESAAAGPAADRSFTTSTLHSQGKLEQKGEIKKLEEKLEKLLTTSTLHSQGKLELKGETEKLEEKLEKLKGEVKELKGELKELKEERDTAHAAAANPAATAKDKEYEEGKEKAATALIGSTTALIDSTTAQIGSTTALVNAITEKMTGDIQGSLGSASVFVVQAVFKDNVQTTSRIREYLYGLVSDAGALKDPEAPYIWYDRASSNADDPDPTIPLNMRVFFENKEAARGLQRHLEEWNQTFRLWKTSAPTSITCQMVAAHAAPQQLEITVRGDYVPAESASVGGPCSETTASSVISSNAPPSTMLSKYQAVDESVPGWTPHQRLHLIPRELIGTDKAGLDKRKKLNRFTTDFWTVAKKQFKVTKEQVEKILENYDTGLNSNDSNFIAATPSFHCLFDGLDGQKVTSFGSSTLVGHARVCLTDEEVDGLADPLTLRYSVKVRFKVLDDNYKGIVKKILCHTDEQEVTVTADGDLCKTFHVKEPELFVIALRFKAACNYVAHLSFTEAIGTFANFVTQLNSD